eukprot:COSAG05_NODE_5744_length_1099_cov_10.200334_1_plen_240_part_01
MAADAEREAVLQPAPPSLVPAVETPDATQPTPRRGIKARKWTSKRILGVESAKDAHITRAETAVDLLKALEAKATHRGPLGRCWHYAFDPTSSRRVGWDVFILGLVIYSCFAVPYKTAFELERELRDTPDSTGMTVGDWVVDALFYVDLVLNFWTGYNTGYHVITDKTAIAKHYLQSRFAVDLLSTVEWDLIARLIICDGLLCADPIEGSTAGATATGAGKRELNDIVSVTRMLKVLRLA